MTNPGVPACPSQSCSNTGVKQLNAGSQGWPRVVPMSGAPWAALSWLQLLSLSTEKGQVAFGASVGVVSFLATLRTAGREGGDKKNNTVFKCNFQVGSTCQIPGSGWGLRNSVIETFIQTQRSSKGITETAETQQLSRLKGGCTARG